MPHDASPPEQALIADTWPSYADELSRKTAEQIARWSSAYDAGRITKRELYIVTSALYDATSGLVHSDIRDLLSTLHASLRKPA